MKRFEVVVVFLFASAWLIVELEMPAVLRTERLAVWRGILTRFNRFWLNNVDILHFEFFFVTFCLHDAVLFLSCLFDFEFDVNLFVGQSKAHPFVA